jgi:ABC-type glutathione transport system ATPase component
MNKFLLEVKNITKSYSIYSTLFQIEVAKKPVLRNISFSLDYNTSLGILGASGCGKTTLVKIISKIEQPDSGEVLLEGKSINSYSKEEFATKIQMLFQNPYAMLNPKLSIGFLLKERVKQNFVLTGKEVDNQIIYSKINELLEIARLPKNILNMYPHQLSGGQRQRVAILMVLSLYPKLVILDEPLSALDISLQAQMLNFFSELKEQFKFSYLFITHDKNLAEYFCDKILYMYEDGRYELQSINQSFKRY